MVCRTSAGYLNQNGECICSSPICSNGCGGHGQCYFLNTLTNSTDCKCDQGYTSTSGSISSTSCSSGYSLSAVGRTCKKICSPEYSGDDCTIYIPTPSCISIPSTALSSCKSYINLDNYRVKNTLFTTGAMNSTHAIDFIISGIKKLYSQASTTFAQTLTSMENQDYHVIQHVVPLSTN